MPNTDDHPLRYHPLREAIEEVLTRRALENKLQGYTLDTSIELLELIYKVLGADEENEHR
jgi:hypothetical protein